ncbi:MAG TPA: HAMP domain-containing sensor histidine kinase [Rhizomicrobium sp.]|jgi:signal transduction histidine kinase
MRAISPGHYGGLQYSAAASEEKVAGDTLDAIMAYRRSEIGYRIAMMTIAGMLCRDFWPLSYMLAWAGLYAAMQIFEFYGAPAIAKLCRTTGSRQFVSTSVIAINSLIFGMPAIAWSSYGGLPGSICGVYLLCGSMLNTVMSTRNCPPAFAASIAPFLLYAIFGAAIAAGSPLNFPTFFVVTAVCSMTALTALRLWHRDSNTRQSETSALRALHSREAQLELALHRAEAANRAKHAFLMNMSHELRTPLNAVIGFSDIMTKGIFGPLGSDKYKEFAIYIHDGGKRLLNLVSDILEFSALESGEVAFKRDRTDLQHLISDCVSVMADQAQAKRIDLKTVWTDSPFIALADPMRLKHALLHLLSNAVKFTPEGGTVTVTVCERTEDFSVCIADTGVGISEEDMARAFAQFDQVETGTNRRHEGAGLGLPLAKRIIEGHDGSLTLKSCVGTGTVVTITLPKHLMTKENTLAA